MAHLCDIYFKMSRCAIYQHKKDLGDKTTITSCTNYKEVKGIKKLLSKNRG